jgi:hypothetical protein
MEFNTLKEISEYICRVPYIHEYPLGEKRRDLMSLSRWKTFPSMHCDLCMFKFMITSPCAYNW